MSYPWAQGYGSYYPSTTDQHTNGQYQTTRQTSTAVTLPDPTGRHLQTGQNGYGWGTQNQNDYTDHGTSQSYGQNSWRNGQDEGPYSYSRQPTYNESASNAPSSMSYYSSTNQSASQLSTPALHSLAYASGLESAGMQGSRRSQSSTPVNANFPNTAVDRLKSPPRHAQQKHSRPMNNATTDYRPQSSQSQLDTVASAAAALTATANRYQQQQQSQQPTHQSRQAQTSSQSSSAYSQNQDYPSTVSSAAPGNNRVMAVPSEPPTQSTSPYVARANTQQTVQSDPTTSATTTGRNYGRMTPAEIHRRANAAIFSGTTGHQSSDSESTTSIPNFIDPSEVFNPYHYELERRKREEAAQPHSQPQSQSQRIRAHSTDASSALTEANDEGSRKQETRPKKPRKPREKKSRKPEPDQGTVKASSEPNSEDMASEMRSMIDKMREWKSKDPKLFQTLWDDMKKGSASMQSAAAALAQGAASEKGSDQSEKSSDIPWKNASTAVLRSESLPKPGPIKFSTPAQGATSVEPIRLDDDGSLVMEAKQAPQAGAPSANTSAKITWKGEPTRSPAKSNSASLTVSEGLPAPQPNGGTFWPESKRKALADAAAAALSSNPANVGQNTSPSMIQVLLAENPTYIELCQKLEDRGLTLNRQKFARFLLSSVPDLQTASAQQRPATASPAVAASIKSESAPNRHPSITALSPAPPSPTQSQRARPQSAKSAVPQRTVKKSAIPEPLPGSKAAMAKKRDFSEIVDFNQLSDYEDDDPVLKRPRIASPPPQDPPVLPATQPLPPTFGTSYAQPGYRPGPYVNSPAGQYLPQHSSNSRPQPKKWQASVSVVKPVDKEKAFKKSFYNPKTVARDVLIAAGRHPTERPLNYHLAMIMNRVPALASTNQADLSTFDWDSIDPGGPPMPQVDEVDVESMPPRFTLGSRVSAAHAKTAAPPPATAQRGAPATSKSEVNPSSILSRQLSLSSTATPPQPKKAGWPSRLSDVINVDDIGKSSRVPDLSTPPQPALKNAASPGPSMTSSASVSGKRRGRPPGSKNHQHSIVIPVESTRPEEAAAPEFPSFNCEWKSCGRHLHNLLKLQKHIAKAHKPENEGEKFSCWWRKCPLLQKVKGGEWQPRQVFDSQDAWIQHIIKQHLNPLSWELGDGPSDVPVGKTKKNPSVNLSRFAFEPDLASTKPAPYPTSTSAKTQFSRVTDPRTLERHRKTYTSDALTGRQITPIASTRVTTERPLDPMILPIEDPKLQKAYLKTHMGGKGVGKHAAAEELLRAIRWRKEQVGPGIDKGGATLVTEAMRKTLVENEGIARVVSDDEDSDDGAI